MAPTIARTVVDRPAAEVFAYATDPARFHEWQQGVIEGHLEARPRGGGHEMPDHPAHRRGQPDLYLRAHPHRRTQDMGRAGHRRTHPRHC